jgi:histone H3/H4
MPRTKQAVESSLSAPRKTDPFKQQKVGPKKRVAEEAPKVKKVKTEVKQEEEEPSRPHRFRPGTVALRNIKKQQAKVDLVVPGARMFRLVKRILAEHYPEMKIYKGAFYTVHSISEDYIVKLLRLAMEMAIKHGKVSLMEQDVVYMKELMDTLHYVRKV